MFGSILKEPQINLLEKFDETCSNFKVSSIKYVSSSNFINIVI
jgi:hypothetical protein